MTGAVGQRKLCLVMVDSLRTDKLEEAVAEGQAPNFAVLLARGELVPDCVSAFPSVTPVCSAEIATGATGERHWIPAMNWYHRVERRYVEYGSSFEATRAFGLFRATYDIVYNMNMAHLSHEVETIFESLADAGMRTACTPFLIFRGRHRHELGLDGLMRRGAVAAGFRHAVYGPDELFYGELFTSRPVPCRPTLARPGTRDVYSACVTKELVAADAYDFLLFSLPDNDYQAHRFGPDAMGESIVHADRCFGELAEACGGLEAFLESHAVILMADHAQTYVDRPYDVAAELGKDWRVLQPSADQPELAELAVSPTARAANVYLLVGEGKHVRSHARVREQLCAMDGTDLLVWLAGPNGEPVMRDGVGLPFGDGAADAGGALEAVVESPAGGELRFRAGGRSHDLRSRCWNVRGDLEVLGLERRGGALVSDRYPDALGRLWGALTSPHAGDILVSLAEGWECVDWGGTSHCPGGSHGSLLASDSLAPLLLVGFEEGTVNEREQWRLCDVAGLVRRHYGLAEGDPAGTAAAIEVEA